MMYILKNTNNMSVDTKLYKVPPTTGKPESRQVQGGLWLGVPIMTERAVEGTREDSVAVPLSQGRIRRHRARGLRDAAKSQDREAESSICGRMSTAIESKTRLLGFSQSLRGGSGSNDGARATVAGPPIGKDRLSAVHFDGSPAKTNWAARSCG